MIATAPGISASPSEDNMRYFNVMILGPTQSPYEGKLFISMLILSIAVGRYVYESVFKSSDNLSFGFVF